jgi:hypothetical protein
VSVLDSVDAGWIASLDDRHRYPFLDRDFRMFLSGDVVTYKPRAYNIKAFYWTAIGIHEAVDRSCPKQADPQVFKDLAHYTARLEERSQRTQALHAVFLAAASGGAVRPSELLAAGGSGAGASASRGMDALIARYGCASHIPIAVYRNTQAFSWRRLVE